MGGNGRVSKPGKEIKAAGGVAVADYNSVAEGDKIVETAVKAFGTVHILVNNAGILRDVAFRNMKDADWDLVMQVHVQGSYKVWGEKTAALMSSVPKRAGPFSASRNTVAL